MSTNKAGGFLPLIGSVDPIAQSLNVLMLAGITSKKVREYFEFIVLFRLQW